MGTLGGHRERGRASSQPHLLGGGSSLVSAHGVNTQEGCAGRGAGSPPCGLDPLPSLGVHRAMGVSLGLPAGSPPAPAGLPISQEASWVHEKGGRPHCLPAPSGTHRGLGLGACCAALIPPLEGTHHSVSWDTRFSGPALGFHVCRTDTVAASLPPQRGGKEQRRGRQHKGCDSQHRGRAALALCPASRSDLTVASFPQEGQGGGRREGVTQAERRGGGTERTPQRQRAIGERMEHFCAHLSSWKLATPRWKKPTARQASLVTAWSNA